MSKTGKAVAWLYGLQLFLIVPWFLGAIYRGEQSLWAWQQYEREVVRHGHGDGVLLMYFYALFYSSLVAIPYAALGLRYPIDRRGPVKDVLRAGRLLIGIWFAGTFVLFAEPLFAFIRSLPTDVWNGWLLILWAVSVVFTGTLVAGLERRISQAKRSEGNSANQGMHPAAQKLGGG